MATRSHFARFLIKTRFFHSLPGRPILRSAFFRGMGLRGGEHIIRAGKDSREISAPPRSHQIGATDEPQILRQHAVSCE